MHFVKFSNVKKVIEAPTPLNRALGIKCLQITLDPDSLAKYLIALYSYLSIIRMPKIETVYSPLDASVWQKTML